MNIADIVESYPSVFVDTSAAIYGYGKKSVSGIIEGIFTPDLDWVMNFGKYIDNTIEAYKKGNIATTGGIEKELFGFKKSVARTGLQQRSIVIAKCASKLESIWGYMRGKVNRQTEEELEFLAEYIDKDYMNPDKELYAAALFKAKTQETALLTRDWDHVKMQKNIPQNIDADLTVFIMNANSTEARFKISKKKKKMQIINMT